MNGSMGNMASGAPETPVSENILSLKTVQRMLPLVQRILDDVVNNQQTLEKLLPEQERLDRQKRDLAWPERQRRYDLLEQLTTATNKLQSAKDELQDLGVALLDPHQGRVGFPTLVNNRRAFFSWQMGEDGLHSWHFAEESVFRPIPAAWLKELSISGKM
jgi:hypothetical protein